MFHEEVGESALAIIVLGVGMVNAGRQSAPHAPRERKPLWRARSGCHVVLAQLRDALAETPYVQARCVVAESGYIKRRAKGKEALRRA